ncbi:MAG: hypothetical protein NTX71_08845 [Candidatus Aureabacteria bacterium]|nr:hypothetical protein [Candidatus Auribacterota bacterium]
MVKRLSLACLILLLAAALDRAAWPQGPQPLRPPDAPPIASAGRMVGDKSRDTFLAAGGFFTKFGATVAQESTRLFIKQGKFWKRFGQSFADFQEQPVGQPRKIDQL